MGVAPKEKGVRGYGVAPKALILGQIRQRSRAVLGALSAGAKLGRSGWGVAYALRALMSPPFWWNCCNMPQHHRDATQAACQAASRAGNQRVDHVACLDEGDVVLLGRGVDVGHRLTRELRSIQPWTDNAPFLTPVSLLSHPCSGCQAAGPPRPPGGWSAHRKPSRGGAARAPPPSPPSTPPRLREGRPTASGSHAHATRPGTEGQGRRRPGKRLREGLPGSAVVAPHGGSRPSQRASPGFGITTRHATRPSLKSRTRTEHLMAASAAEVPST